MSENTDIKVVNKIIKKLCPEGKIKRNCHICTPNRFCPNHPTIRKSRCTKCKIGCELCKCGKDKSTCSICDPSLICPCGVLRKNCKNCNKEKFCPNHPSVRKDRCVDCNGSLTCPCGKQRYLCSKHGGGGLCPCGHQKAYCSIHNGTAFCGCLNSNNTKKQRKYCRKHGSSGLCKSTFCDTQKNPSCDGYCSHCFRNLFPDDQRIKNYKTKEKSVADFILTSFPSFNWIVDKKIKDGVSNRRPDLLLELDNRVLIIEIDEYQHSDYAEICENKRMMELFIDIGSKQLTIIRFNPDSYITYDNENIKSCWKLNRKSNIVNIDTTEKENWKIRLNILKDITNYWIKTKSEKELNVIHLFYNDFDIIQILINIISYKFKELEVKYNMVYNIDYIKTIIKNTISMV